MPSFAFRVAWCAAAAGVAAIAGCSLDMNGTGALLADGAEDSGANSDGTTETTEGSASSDAGDAGAADATMPDGSLQDGTVPDASLRETAAPDGTPPDAISGGNEGSIDAPTCTTTNGGTCVVVPPGWSIVAFAGGRTQACPSEFNAGSSDVFEAPNAANACSCGACAVTTQPACDQGTIGVTYGMTTGGGFGGGGGGFGGGGQATCTTAGTGLPVSPGSPCVTYPPMSTQGPGTFDAVQYTPPAPTGGSCSSAGVADPNQITYGAEERVCTAGASVTQACSSGQPCGASVGGGYAICIMLPGAPVACPAGSPLSTPHWVGGQATLSCSACGCGVDSVTCSGTLDTFRDATCAATDTTFTVDGTCQGSFTAANAAAYRYTPDAVNASCTATGASSATNVALTSPATICCAQ